MIDIKETNEIDMANRDKDKLKKRVTEIIEKSVGEVLQELVDFVAGKGEYK